VQLSSHTLICRIERSGPVLVSLFGNLALGEVAPREIAEGSTVRVASLPDIRRHQSRPRAATRSARDYLDIDALIRHGIDLPRVLAAGAIMYGHRFNPLITLKALSYFEDVTALPAEVREPLSAAVEAVDPTRLPMLAPHIRRADDNGHSS
jgi:hypothetical protein